MHCDAVSHSFFFPGTLRLWIAEAPTVLRYHTKTTPRSEGVHCV